MAVGSVAGTALVGSIFGAAGAGITGYRMKKRVGGIEEFELIRLDRGQGSRLHVTIAIPGWLPPPSNSDDTLAGTTQTFSLP